jgi:hypothetical protein
MSDSERIKTLEEDVQKLAKLLEENAKIMLVMNKQINELSDWTERQLRNDD